MFQSLRRFHRQAAPKVLNTLTEPVWDTVKRDLSRIVSNLKLVVFPNPYREDPGKALRDWDLWGPFFFILFLGLTLSWSASVKKSEVFAMAFGLLGAGAVILTLNALLLGGHVIFFQSLSLLGYCLFPLDIGAVIYMLKNNVILKMIVVSVTLAWSSWSVHKSCRESEKKSTCTLPAAGELNLEKKRKDVYELSKQPKLASEILEKWTRKDLIQILCLELGQERKYTGIPKIKIIEKLLNTVSGKNPEEHHEEETEDSDSYYLPIQRSSKSPRKVSNPSRYVKPEDAVKMAEEKEEEEIRENKGLGFKALVTSHASLPITSDQNKNCNNKDNPVVDRSSTELEDCLKTIRQLEISGHIGKDFRQKFLTWYSLKATSLEIKIVKTFIYGFSDDPMALAEQLVHTFENSIM